MNKLFWALSISISILSCSPRYDIVRRDANKTPSPPGTIWLKENIFMDETEITNLAWREFVAWNKKMCGSNSVAYTLSKPDTLVWRKLLSFCEPYIMYYHSHPSYNNYPVVGITKQQAESYCKWRTFVVNQKIYIDENNLENFDIDTLVHFPVKYIYRLPTTVEWEYAASGGLNTEIFPYGFEDLKFKYKKKYLNKINWDDTTHSKLTTYGHWNDNGLLANNYKYGKPNKFGFYNMPGNVAEMVAEDSIAKGGSYRHYPDSCKIDIDIAYGDTEAWLGFRCVCEEVVYQYSSNAVNFLNFDYYINIHPNTYRKEIKDSLFTNLVGKVEIKSHSNYYNISITEFKSIKNLRDLIQLDSTETIISFHMMYWTKTLIFHEEIQSAKFSSMMKDFITKSQLNELIIFDFIEVKNSSINASLPPVYIILKE